MLAPTLFLLALGFGASVMLVIASRVFYVYEDPKIQEVEESLLGANCGGCGYPGCSAAAAAVVQGKAGANVCVAGGAEVALKVAAVMGLEVEIAEPVVAHSTCKYSIREAETQFEYAGVRDCRAAAAYGGGPKRCPIGCVNLGTCIRACPFGAISEGKNGLPVFHKDKCRGCGICVEVCPKDIIHLTSTTNRMIGDFRTDECTTPCQRVCPTGVDIPAYICEIANGNYEEAVRIIKERCPFPLIIGRICPAPCEMECRRIHVEQAVGINNLKRFVADFAMKKGSRIHPYRAPDSGKRVAVIGGGAQGLTTAYYLACLGHRPTVFEAGSRLGGILRFVIPPSRLPREVIDWEIEGILDAGVSVVYGVTAGKDVTIDSLFRDGFDAVVTATGGRDAWEIMHNNEARPYVVPGVNLVMELCLPRTKNEEIRLAGSVCVYGSGNSAVEAARLCLRAGASSVILASPHDADALKARGFAHEELAREGIGVRYETVIGEIRGRGKDLSSLMFVRASGEREEIQANALFVSAGRLSDLVLVPDRGEGTWQGEWRSLASQRMDPACVDDDIFSLSGGQIHDNLSVVRSIGKGRRIARAVHLYLSGKDCVPQESQIKPGMPILNTKDIKGVTPHPRNLTAPRMNIASLSEAAVLFSSNEIDEGLSEQAALDEARRCLDCGLICYRKSDEKYH